VRSDPLEFLLNSQLSTNLVCFYQLPFELGSHPIPLSMMSCENFSLGLNANSFLYPLTVRGVGCA